MTDKELSIKEYARLNELDPLLSLDNLKAHNFFFLSISGYWVVNIKRKKNTQDGWYIKEDDFFKTLKKINRKLKLENLNIKN